MEKVVRFTWKSSAATLPDNPFRPGFGTTPPFLAGRDHEKDHLRNLVRRLRVGERKPEAILLHGPRGNGKTALIGWLESEAGDRLNLRQIMAHSVSDPTAVATDLLESHQNVSRAEMMHGMIGGGVPGVFRGEGYRQLARRNTATFLLHDAMKRLASERPLLMIMDEVHTADPAGLAVFLNALQDSAQMLPMRLVLAGTPKVRHVLAAASTSFLDRIRKLPIGLLTTEAGCAAIAEPFADHGIDTDDGVVEQLAAWADNYPYFLQLVGDTAWTEAANFGRLTSGAGRAAINRARVRGDLYFSTRYEEMAAAGHLEFGVAIAKAMCTGKNRIHKNIVEEIARQHCGKGWNAAVDFIVQKGFLWRADAEREYQPGIPSLLRYTIREHETDLKTARSTTRSI